MTTLLRSVARGAWCDRRTAIGLVWLVGFSVFFFSFDLPNNPPATRWQIWQIVPFQLLDVIWPLPEPNAPPSGWMYLPQRLEAIGTALATLCAAFGVGSVLLRWLRLAAELSQLEWLYLAGGIGLSVWSLMTLGLGLFGYLDPALFRTLITLGIVLMVWSTRMTEKSPVAPPSEIVAPRVLMALVLAVCVPLVWAMLLGALTPQSDFDVLAYHLNGPKEWFQTGRIEFLPHNVYTSFPFLTEMLLLSGMVLLNDWSYGALAGQAVLMMFAPLTAIGLYCAGRRWFSESAGWLAALVWLTTPWTYRISIIAYAEGGLAFYLLASFLAAGHAVRAEPYKSSWFLLCGFFAGSAMACKYTGLTSVVVPVGLGLALILLRRRYAASQSPLAPAAGERGRGEGASASQGAHQRYEPSGHSPPLPNPLPRGGGEGTRSLIAVILPLFAYGLGLFIAVGPWLAKNFWETGNPVYPLAYSVFDGRDLDAELNAKWVQGHAAKKYVSFGDGLHDFLLRFQDIVADNDWHSPLLYGLAPLSLFWMRRCQGVLWAWLFLGWLFLTWFFLTHHIDRFWVPMIPVVALLAGAGAATLTTSIGRWLGGVVIAAAVAFNLTICSLIGGYNAGLTELSRAQHIAETALTPEIRWLNDEFAAGRLPADFKLLCEGEAATFHARFPVAYHSVFDLCLLEEWCAAGPGPEFPLKSAEEIRETFRMHGITHVFVNWRWILTYREPGNYGFTDFVTPERLRQLQELGVLGPPLRLPEPLGIAPLTDERRQQLEREGWSRDLIVPRGSESAYLGGQIFPVR